MRKQLLQVFTFLCVWYFPCSGYSDGNRLSKCDESEFACRIPFKLVGDSCLLFSLAPKLSWRDARAYCLERASDLAIIRTGNQLVATMDYLKGINTDNSIVSAWIGGSDLEQLGTWKWVDGTLMPRGSPFWGTYVANHGREPHISGERCVFMYARDGYSFHDFVCDGVHGGHPGAPLCQYLPEITKRKQRNKAEHICKQGTSTGKNLPAFS